MSHAMSRGPLVFSQEREDNGRGPRSEKSDYRKRRNGGFGSESKGKVNCYTRLLDYGPDNVSDKCCINRPCAMVDVLFLYRQLGQGNMAYCTAVLWAWHCHFIG